jgi:hypothetical protein
MNRNRALSLAAIGLLNMGLLMTAACKTSGMAVTSHGQLLKINIEGANNLPEGGTEDLNVKISNRGPRDIKDVYVDVEVPPEVTVLSQTNDRGIQNMHDPGSMMYHFTMGNIQPTETSTIRFAVRTAFGSLDQTGSIKVTAWQKDLPGDKLVETRVIKLTR